MSKRVLHNFEDKRTAGFRHATLWDVFYIILFCLVSVGIFKYVDMPRDPIVSPVQASMLTPTPTQSVLPTQTPTPTPDPETLLNVTPDRQEIVIYIKKVFGSHADNAFLLLSCENNSLNPEAVNTAGNYPPGSRDTGVFQINEYWQAVQYKFLLNWKINVEIAYQLYVENGYSFKLWTCGRKYGI